VRREVDPLSASDGEDDTQEVVIGLSLNGDSAQADPSVAGSDPTGAGDEATIDDAELEALFGEANSAVPAGPAVASPYPDASPSPSPYPDSRAPALDTTESAVIDALPGRQGGAPVPAARPSRVPAVGSLEGDVMVLAEPASGALVAPRKIGTLERRRRVKLQARRVRRIVRHLEPWSVMKMSIIFYACLWVILLVAGVVVWSIADSAGVIDSLERQIKDYFVLDTFELNANEVFRGYAFGGLFFAIAGTAFNVLMCLLFNLISDLVGGLRITMIEEETARPRPVRRVRRPRPTR
jgi:Transmembrane domain of unknown function (DUF3566)